MSPSSIPALDLELDDWEAYVDMDLYSDSTTSIRDSYVTSDDGIIISQPGCLTDPNEYPHGSSSTFLPITPSTPAANNGSKTPHNSPELDYNQQRYPLPLGQAFEGGTSGMIPSQGEHISLKRPLNNEGELDLNHARDDSARRTKRVRSRKGVPSSPAADIEQADWSDIKTQLEVCKTTLLKLEAMVDLKRPGVSR